MVSKSTATKLKKSIVSMWEAKVAADDAAADKASAQGMIIDLMTKEDVSNFVVEGTEYGDLSATLVTSSTTEIDMNGLLEFLSEEVIDQISEKVVSEKKLEAAIALGVVKAQDVAKYTHTKPRTPYVKITPKGA